MTAGTLLRTEEGEPVRIEGERLFKGGEGEIYRVDRPGQVAKLYHGDKRGGIRERKLKDMLANAPNIERLCWPGHLLYDGDRAFVGYLMPRAPESAKAFQLSVLQLGKPTVQERVLPGWNRKDLVRTAKAVADMAAKLHKRGILIGDINDGNFLADPGDSSAVYLVDCDSYQFNGYPCPVGTPDYTHPGTAGRLGISGDLKFGEFLRLESEEDYALSILIFRILTLGQYPFHGNGKTPDQAMRERLFPTEAKDAEKTTWLIRKNLPKAIDDAFTAAFKQWKAPTAGQWSGLLKDYLYYIEHFGFSLELAPSTYHAYSEEASRFYRDVVCDCDRKRFNIPKETYAFKRRNNEPVLCPACQDYFENIRATRRLNATESCSSCGRAFPASDGQAFLRHSLNPPVPVHCPDCERKETFICAQCRRTDKQAKWRLERNRNRGFPNLCRACRRKYWQKKDAGE